MRKDNKNLVSLGVRYLLLLLAPIYNLYFFYLILTPLTIYPVFFLLNLFFQTSLLGTTIFVKDLGLTLEIVNSCIAGSAYYLLLILNLSVPNIKIKKRVLLIGYSFSALLLINIIRIVSLALLFSNTFFGITHQLTWYFFSTFFVVLIWFSEVKFFKIKEIPIYSDVKFLLRKIKK